MLFICNMRYNTTTLCLVGAIVVLLLLVFYLYQQSQKHEGLDLNVKNEPETPGPSTAPPNTGTVKPSMPMLVLFHASWCPHCKDVLPLWPQIKANMEGKLAVIDVESKDPVMAKHKIQGFPTIRFFPQGIDNTEVYVDHTGPRSVEGVMQFLAGLSKPQ